MPHVLRLIPWLVVLMVAGCAQNSQQPVPLGSDTHVTRANDRVEVISKVHHIDRIYPSMTGPWSAIKIKLLEQPKPELVWITGAEVRMLDASGQQRMPDEFMCHANFDLDSVKHCEQLGLSKTLDGRLFTLSQGQLSVNFPKGTGIPVRSDLPLDLVTQALNLNLKDANLDVRHQVTIHFVRDCDVHGTMIPLYESGASSQVTLEDHPLAYDIMDHGTGAQVSGMCIPGQQAMGWDEREDRYGRRFTGHWVVPPGRQEYRTRCTSIMNVPYDTKVYAIAVHLHPLAESLELHDVTENTTIFKSHAVNFQGKLGLESIESFASPDGVPMYNSHEYELRCVYNNTTKKNVDSMAVMYLYLGDTEFNRDEVMRRLTADLQPQESLAGEASDADLPRM